MKQCVSIIIPAHNEAKVMVETLSAFLSGIKDGFIEVIVVCNGCTDNTAQVVTALDKSIICIEKPVASKPDALNLGDAAANWFPRIYQDADVLLSVENVKMIVEVLRNGLYLAAAPAMKMEYHNASWVVQAYYNIWQSLPYV